jgi:hypothetical protein
MLLFIARVIIASLFFAELSHKGIHFNDPAYWILGGLMVVYAILS